MKHAKIFLWICLIALFARSSFADDLPSIESNEPIVVPATQEKTYSKYWMKSLSVYAPSPTEKTSLTAVFIPFDGQGSVLAEGHETILSQDDLFAVAGQDPSVAQAMGAVLIAMKNLCIAQEKCSNT